MAESQVVEYKESWKDEYLKWICGFANAQGGRIYIGINDKGEVIGVKDIKKLLEDIPNKVRDKLGIIADVNRLEKDGIAYIEIIVAPSGVPINYQGEYHYRSGSTKQLLQGVALTQFLMKKTGIRWDSVSVNNIDVDDLDEVSIEIFKREALRKKRISEADLKVSRTELLDHLNLLDDNNLKRAAVMLFYKRPAKLVEGCYIKIGKFGDGADLQYQDQLEGSLFRMADQVIDLIYTKYLKAKITYEHNVRVETYPFPIDGVREAIYNAIAHNNYARCVPIQIRIQDDAMYISNSCILPSGWDVESLLQPHRSVPFNPAIANAFYRAGYIETWGRGIQKIYDSCKALGVPAPEYSIVGEDITVKFTAHDTIFSDTINDNDRENDIVNDTNAENDRDNDTENDINTENDRDNDTENDINTENDRDNDIENDTSIKNDRDNDIENDTSIKNDRDNDIENDANTKNDSDNVKLTKAEKRIINIIIQNPHIKTNQLCERATVSSTTVSRSIKKLKEIGYIKRIGSDRDGYWEIIK